MCLAIPGKVIAISRNEGSDSVASGDSCASDAFEALWGDVLFSETTGGEILSGKTQGGQIQGVRRKVNLSYVPEVVVGEYVIVHAGFAISLLDQEEAQATLSVFRGEE